MPLRRHLPKVETRRIKLTRPYSSHNIVNAIKMVTTTADMFIIA
ncbi:hypothetical protein V3C99_005852, partial [Haemonchus contortus]